MTSRSLNSPPLTADGFRDLARRVLDPLANGAPAGTRNPSDFDLNPDLAFDAQAEAGMPPQETAAAVLIAAVPRDEIMLLLTQRTDHLPKHAGQIAFPGGKTEKSDSGPLATAMREAHEEIGLDPALVEPLGFLDSYRTGTGFRITPVVALVEPHFELTLNRGEVADAFEVPWRFLMDTGNHQLHVRTIAGRERRFYAMPYEKRFIWGATAGILRNMQERFCLS
jgi:8-oxo-dGTP pyrophosphatase MutT (NUDIX family)